MTAYEPTLALSRDELPRLGAVVLERCIRIREQRRRRRHPILGLQAPRAPKRHGGAAR